MKKSAFTLIELLVVISIIAILAAIAIPVFSSALERGRATSDASQLRQMGIGITSFLSENEDTMFSVNANPTWPVALQQKYLPDWRAFKSPFDRRKDTTNPSPVSYGINSYLFTPATDKAKTPGTETYSGSTSQFVSPSELILMAPVPDAKLDNLSFSHTSQENIPLVPPAPSPKYGTHSRRNLINVVYTDTHTATLTWQEFSDATSDPSGLRRWQPLGKAP